MLLWCCCLLIGRPVEAQSIQRGEFFQPDNEPLVAQRYEKKVEIGPGVIYDAIINVTTKGNGLLEFSTLRLHVFDEHDDGAYYEKGLLDIEFVDLDKDQYKDIIISGSVRYTNEQGQVVRNESVIFIYMFDPEPKRFTRAFRKGSLNLD